ncbi:MAG: 1,4-alpha-glucan branching protein GlgB [Clostridiales bacterium]|nr:1,4-alpha-glucan branching protein GlgB [Clostridiales bacterium]
MNFISDMDIYLFRKGVARRAYSFMGCHPSNSGFRFTVWAPNANNVSVVGDFNNWDSRLHPMNFIKGPGLWELDIPGLHEGMNYKFHVIDQAGKGINKTDPYAFFNELPPANASIIKRIPQFNWTDSTWSRNRINTDIYHSPVSIYEVHSSSFKRHTDGSVLSWGELAEELIPWVKNLGFTHIELMPITEYPLDASWGYQVTGYFSPTSRHGDPEGLMYFIDRCHNEGLGVLLDWVPAHFPKDKHSLARFDGTALYEHSDSRLGEQPQWGTAVFDYSRHEVINFLISSAVFWLDVYHFDGLRVDAVSSMLYRTFGRENTEWLPNEQGGDESPEGVCFLQLLSKSIKEESPGTLLIAEEATSWPGVTKATSENGLGFSYKWNMGWMNDILNYINTPFNMRKDHYKKLTFALHYIFSENYVLPFSHDEVIHGKLTLLDKMPGTYEQKFSGLRSLLGYMYAMPGFKLLFMGNEMAPFMEWRYYEELEWDLLKYPMHEAFKEYLSELNRFYKDNDAFWDEDHSWDGFRWVIEDDSENGIIAFERISRKGSRIIAIVNFMPVSHESYRIGFPNEITLTEVLNTECKKYNSEAMENLKPISTEKTNWKEFSNSLEIKIPSISTLYFKVTENRESNNKRERSDIDEE